MTPRAACPSPAILGRWLVGRVFGDDAEGIERHVGACESCAATLQSLGTDDPLACALRPPLRPDETPFADRAEALMPALKRLRPPNVTADWAISAGVRTRPHDSAAAPADAPLPQAGATVGGYELLGPIGAGGMGVVFRAEDPVLRRNVALKLIQPALVTSAAARARFLHEAQALAALEHDHVVTVYRAGEDNGVLFLAMPLLRGRTLQDRLEGAGGPLPVEEVLRVGREIASGLAAAHARGLVHRDIKPGNVWLSQQDPAAPGPGAPFQVKILDFGLAQALTGGDGGTPGTVLGTPEYMAPEQAAGKVVDGRADLFSLGCVMYHAATGRRPFAAPDVARLLRSVRLDEPVPPRDINPAVPVALEALIARLLRKNPADRPPAADAVVAAVGAIEGARERRLSRRKWLAVAGGAALAAAAGGVGAARTWFRDPPPAPGEVAFTFAEPDARIALRLGDEPERVIDLRAGAALSLAPGDYAARALAATARQRLWPDRVVVEAGAKSAVELSLVGLGGEHLQHSPHAVSSVAVRERAGRLTVLSVGRDRSVVAWDPASKDRPRQRLDPVAPALCAALRPDGGVLAVGAGDVGAKAWQVVRFWDPVTLERTTGEFRLPASGLPIALAYSPDGKWLFTGQTDGTLLRWEIETGVADHDPADCGSAAHAIVLSRKGDRAFVVGGDGTVSEWTTADLKRVRKFGGAAGTLRGVVLAGAKTLIAAGQDGTVREWDLGTGGVAAAWPAPQPVRALAVSPDGTRLATGDEGGGLRLWDVAKRQEVTLFEAHARPVTSVAFAADGRRVATGGADGAVRVWAVPK